MRELLWLDADRPLHERLARGGFPDRRPHRLSEEIRVRFPVRQLHARERIERAEAFFAATGAVIREGGDRAFYSMAEDRVQMPPFVAFKEPEAYYATLAHELTHWTKHEKRLARDFGRKRFGDEGYAMEELVAELGAAFVCADLALTPAPRAEHAAYIASWLKALKDDKRAIFAAAAHAQRAADYLARFSTPEAVEEPEKQSAAA